MTAKANIGRSTINGANSETWGAAMSETSEPAIQPPQFLRTSTSSNDIVSC